MYVYVYDESVIKNEAALHKIEKRLTDLGLNGQIIRPGVSKNLKIALEDKIKQGAKTIVAVGGDIIISQTINFIANSQDDNKHLLTIGVIPLDKNSIFGQAFGINNVDEACETLLSRRVEKLFLSRINENFFLFRAEITDTDSTILEINKKFTIQSPLSSDIYIFKSSVGNSLKINLSNKEGESLLRANTLLIVSKDKEVISDGAFKTASPALIEPDGGELKFVVGRKRNLNIIK
jgi:NDP-sugar pyrophosphorylase family protein